MSPERINTDINDAAYDGYADDIWSFGLSILEFYLGRFPFGENLGRHDDSTALMVTAESLSEEEIAGLKEMFQTMDTDNSGAITYDELKVGLRRYGSTLKDTEIRDLMEAADVDNSGTIDYMEFIAATLHLNKLEREEHLVAAFSCFDKDGNSYITVDDLQQAWQEHNMPDAFLDDVIKEADQDNCDAIELVQ
ncbi:hypothetical protein ZWY2020_038581 [Hordeum vulgare]|nr:hypothetical protein ZWY2020_038581 [Hordeum vulgare]